jgi:serine/threonine-protein kinase
MSEPSSEPQSRAQWGARWIGRTVGDYELKQILGSGGMGTVFLGEHVRLLRKAAAKILRPDHKDRPEVAARLQAEARAMLRVCHPGVVSIIDQGTIDDDVGGGGVGFLIMEYLPGQSLRQELKEHGGFPLEVCLRILQQVATAMAAAHAVGVIHRDLSPANIMCLPAADGEAPRVKILDFGLARLYSADGLSSSSLNTKSTTRDGSRRCSRRSFRSARSPRPRRFRCGSGAAGASCCAHSSSPRWRSWFLPPADLRFSRASCGTRSKSSASRRWPRRTRS